MKARAWACAGALGVAALLASPPPVHAEGDAERAEAVVVLHGLGRTPRNMQRLADRLSAAGYAVHNLGYPSTRGRSDDWIARLAERIARRCGDAPRVHFVTHSLGGIVTRALLARDEVRPERLGRVVMLAPPNQGSEWVDRIGDWSGFRLVFGDVASELGTAPGSWPNRLPPADFPVGVIAGDAIVNPIGAWLVPGDSDGTVSVARTRLDGMHDFIVVPHSHTFIMDAPRVAEETLHFLAEGRFSEDALRPEARE